MSDLREPMLTLALGMKGIGKTFLLKQIIEEYAKGNPALGIKPRRVLIFDVQNEYPYKTIPLSQVKAFSYHPKIEIRRVTYYKANGKVMSLNEMQVALNYILDNYSNGMLVLEDISKYISDSFNRDVIGKIISIRHCNVDLTCNFQLKGKAGHPKLIGNTNYIRLHETTDYFEAHKDKFTGHMTELKIAECLVKLLNDRLPDDERRSFVYIGMQIPKISGDFSKEDFKEAIRKYISENQGETIAPLLRRTNREGKKEFNNNSAHDYLEEAYFKKHYGNE